MRFRPEQHLRRQADIRGVREEGARVDARAFTIWWRPRPDPAIRRAGFAASTSAVGPAVQRNRAKRRLREVFRRSQHLLPPGCDLLLVARAAVNRWPFAELDARFADACHQIATRPWMSR